MPVLCALAVAALAVAPAAARAGSLRWLAAGDSYSSGEGLPHSTGPCAQGLPGSGSTAWAFVAWQALGGNKSRYQSPALTACTGETAHQFFPGPNSDSPEWYPGSGRWNLVTFTFGGDDVNFAGFLTDCVTYACPPDSAARKDIATFGSWYKGFLTQVANQVVTQGGDVVVLGYPELIANPDTWTGVAADSPYCQGVSRGGANEIRGLSGDLNATIGSDVNAVNAAHPNGVTLRFVDVESGGSNGIASNNANLFEPAGAAGHLLCGPDSWINGLTTIDSGNGSFHPKQAGQNAMGALAAIAIGGLPSGGGSSSSGGGGSAGGGSPAGGGSSGGGGTAGGSGSSGGGGSTPTPGGGVPAGSVAETAGGNTNTWTDYSDGGGTEGQPISKGATVGVTCKLHGLAVQDGNTWWYLVASSPWGGQFYASADAFYNDGQTSGSLLGSAYVDPAVPDCTGSGNAQPPSGAGTTSETTGGVTHTWTDYSDAGGTQGQSIAANDTVQIDCRVQGLAVADGNTWWYAIASSPWSYTYYASADAFYNDGATSGSLLGTPFVDTSVPICGAGSPGGGGSTAAPAKTYTETVGGVTHTWTNYSDAGGTQGPSIQPNVSVQITCRVQGFTVADGNTWWYQIDSSPWSNAYYASADAFYNDGATSGSLLGTPFYDPAVPACGGGAGGGSSGGSPGSGGSSPTWSESVGGVTHTWTNYSDAGGTQGPSIQTGTAVQITCRVQGFTVADGNTWWYQIASSPWSNAYYASADAFYNNGQTTGSLLGTPFYDSAVAVCGSSSGGGGSPPPPPAPTWSETVGSVTHTWTNYSDAGGTEGPSIPNGTTVQITCRLQGFKVADGNTWWYRIASSPWSNTYYASADAFYNNGQTSGSLLGTPFVDPNVATC